MNNEQPVFAADNVDVMLLEANVAAVAAVIVVFVDVVDVSETHFIYSFIDSFIHPFIYSFIISFFCLNLFIGNTST